MSMARAVSRGSVIAGAGVVRHAGSRGRERRLPVWSARIVLGAWAAWAVACSPSPTDNTQSATTYTLTVANSGTGSGTVTGPGIACGADCTETVVNGTSITLAAAAATGSAFVSWTGCDAPSGTSCTMSMTAPKSVTATFNSVPATYTLTITTTGSGSVTRNPSQTSYAAGTQVQLTAIPQPGSMFSSWSGALTGSQNPAIVTMNGNHAITANFVAAAFTLTVAKAGLGGGTVTGTGINCGTDCTENLGSVSVTLTATPASGSVFDHWAGCDVVSTNTCTVNMAASRTVTATFSLSLSPPTVSVPATSTTGSYNVTVNCTGLCSTTFVLQEAPTTAFVNPTQTFYSNSSFPKVIAFSSKAAGTYCYRAAFFAPNWGAPACVTVSQQATGVLRVSNTSSYDIIDVRLNNVQQANFPYGILAGRSADFVFSPGTVNIALGNGFYNPDGTRDIWFTLIGPATVTAGQTTTVTFGNPSIGQLLTNFGIASNWDGMYFDADANSFFRRFRFSNTTNGWQLYNSIGPCFGGTTCSYTLASSGTARLISWPRYSPIVTFDFGPGTTAADIAYPWASFKYANGPSSWPIIEYVRQ